MANSGLAWLRSQLVLDIVASLLGYITYKYFVLYSRICYLLYPFVISGDHVVAKSNKVVQRDKGNVAFFVCCDGRGHLTQCMSLSSMLQDKRMHVTAVFVNCNPYCTVPEYFYEYCRKRSISVYNYYGASIGAAFKMNKVDYLSVFMHSMGTGVRSVSYANYCSNLIKETRTNTVINLFTSECMLYNNVANFGCKIVSLGTQYKGAADFAYLPSQQSRSLSGYDYIIGKCGLDSILRTSSFGGSVVCLSPLPPSSSSVPTFPVIGNTQVSYSKLATSSILELSENKNVICVYALHEGYVSYICTLATLHPDTMFFVFSRWTSNKHVALSNVVPFDISVDLFAACLQHCKVLITTAGIESVCEAIYRSKPVITIPTTGHYEQYENACLFSRLEGISHVSSFSDVESISVELTKYLNKIHDVDLYESQCAVVRNYITNFDTEAFSSMVL